MRSNTTTKEKQVFGKVKLSQTATSTSRSSIELREGSRMLRITYNNFNMVDFSQFAAGMSIVNTILFLKNVK